MKIKNIISILISLSMASCMKPEACDITINPLWIQGLNDSQVVFQFDCDASIWPPEATPNGNLDIPINITASEIYKKGGVNAQNFANARANALQMARSKFLDTAKLGNNKIVDAFNIRCKETSNLKPNQINVCPPEEKQQPVDTNIPPVINPNQTTGGDFNNPI